MTAVDAVNHPPHYTAHPSGVECIEVTRLMPFTLGNAVKYIWRAEHKSGLQDYLKAQWYLRDTLANGCAHHPPARAKQMLMQVCVHDECPRRRYLLQCVANGDLERAIEHIEMMRR